MLLVINNIDICSCAIISINRIIITIFARRERNVGLGAKNCCEGQYDYCRSCGSTCKHF